MTVAWVGAGIAAVGVASSVSSSKKATSAASDASDATLAFEQEKYDDWQSTYGSIQDNLASYYNSISAESYAAMGLENSQLAFETSMKRIDESLAQRGITNSAVSESITAQAELGEAENRAKIRSDAPAAVAQEKQNFLQIGLGQNPGSSMSNALMNNANSLQQQANIQEQAAGSAINNAVTAGGKVVGDYLATSSSSLPDYDPGGKNYSPVTAKNPWE